MCESVCVFAGTTEGRRIVELLSAGGLGVYVCTATQYGGEILSHRDNVRLSAKRLDTGEMTALFTNERFSLVIDATHPFAKEVTANIKAACQQSATEYLRVEREKGEAYDNVVSVDTLGEAARYIANLPGNVLITTGSKELLPYTQASHWRERLYFRVLPTVDSLGACAAAGIATDRIIAMQGPFGREINAAMLKAVNARYLVTKDSGAGGGFMEKLMAAGDAGAIAVVIGRPAGDSGLPYPNAVRLLCQRFGLKVAPRVSIVGIGMGSQGAFTLEAGEAIANAECIIGAKRMIEAADPGGRKACFAAMDSAKIAGYIAEHTEYSSFAVVMSGDVGFYSGAAKLVPLLSRYAPRIYPGISSLQSLCAKLALPWDDAHVVSLHGRNGSIVPAVSANRKVFVLVGGDGAVNDVCHALCRAGLGGTMVSIGERLSYADEKITTGSACELRDAKFGLLSAMLIRNANARPACPMFGLPDDAFVRSSAGETAVPMTKSEVRAVSLAKLMLQEDSVVYDVGAGTGSVSVEMASICKNGHVYAIECKAGAAGLVRENARRFSSYNISVVEGFAPQAFAELPAPTHAFIGGTSGNMREIIEALLEKNPEVRVVVNAIALESMAELTRAIKELGFDETELVQLSVAKAKRLGNYHLMSGQNPITVAVLQKKARNHFYKNNGEGEEVK